MSIPHYSRRLLLAGLFVASGLFGCGAGPYGFARTYKPLASEQRHFEQAQQLTYQDVVREPNAYKKVEIGWFGVVTEVNPGAEGRTRLVLSLRSHQARHLCTDQSSSSCRVTVSAKSLGTFSAELTLRPEEVSGKERVWLGSLLKVYGMPTGDYDEKTGPLLEVTYYRHWPRGYYVSTSARESMRR